MNWTIESDWKLKKESELIELRLLKKFVSTHFFENFTELLKIWKKVAQKGKASNQYKYQII